MQKFRHILFTQIVTWHGLPSMLYSHRSAMHAESYASVVLCTNCGALILGYNIMGMLSVNEGYVAGTL